MNDTTAAPSPSASPDPRVALTSPAGRRVIVALAVGQALLLLLFHEAVLRAWPPFGNLTVRCVYLTLVMAVPTTLYLLLDDPRRRRPWLLAGALGLALLPVALFTGLQTLPASGVRSGPLFVPYGLAMTAAWFVAVAFLQAMRRGTMRRGTMRRGMKRLDYEALFHAGWYHLLALVFTALAVGLFWGVLALWAALFGVVNIDVFGDLFYDRRFIYAATGLAGGLGIVLARSYSGAATTLLRLVMTLLKALLPLVTTLGLLFLAVLPFTGLSALWETGAPTVLMMVLVGLVVLFTNGAFRDGSDAPPYPTALRRLVEAGLVVMPAYALLSAYAVSLRVGQYGWTAERVWAALVVAVLGAFAFAYAGAVFYRRRAGWMQFLKPANTALALALVALLWLTQTPLLSPRRVAVRDQIERLQHAEAIPDASSRRRAEAGRSTLRYLRFKSGKRGYLALQQLQRDSAFVGRPAMAARLDAMLSDSGRVFHATSPPPVVPVVDVPAQLRARLQRFPDTLTVPPAFIDLLAAHATAQRCLKPATSCLLLAADLYGDPRRELVVIRQPARGSLTSGVYTHGDTRDSARGDTAAASWRAVGRLWPPVQVSDSSTFLQSLRDGRYRPVPPQQRDLQVGDRRLRVKLR